MILGKLSQLATNLREHIAFIGLPIANILFLIILIIAKFIGDWRREVDVLGQLALDIKRLAEVFPFWQELFLNLSLNWMTTCLGTCIQNDANTDTAIVLTYRLERCSCVINLLERNFKVKSELRSMANPFDFLSNVLPNICTHAKIYYPALVCRAYTKLALFDILSGNLDQARSSICVAFDFFHKQNGANLAHPSHVAEAKMVWAIIAEKTGDYVEALTRLRQALEYAETEFS